MTMVSPTIKRLIESSTVDEDYLVISQINYASAIVETYIGTVDNASDFVRGATAKICVYNLFQRINENIPESVVNGYKETMQMLIDAQKYNIKVKDVSSTKASALNKKVGYLPPLHLNY